MLTAAQISGENLAATKGGIYRLDKADLFNLLCIPPLDDVTDTPVTVWQDAMLYCQSRRAMLLVDPPLAWTALPETAAAGIDRRRNVEQVARRRAALRRRLRGTSCENTIRLRRIAGESPCVSFLQAFA